MTASPPAYVLIPLPGEGPEDVVAGPDGVTYTGLEDGRILAVAPKRRDGQRNRQHRRPVLSGSKRRPTGGS